MSTDNKKKRKLPDEEEEGEIEQDPPVKRRKLDETAVANKHNKNTNKEENTNKAKVQNAVQKVSEQSEQKLKLPDLPLTIIFLTGNKGKLHEVQSYVGEKVKKYIINHKVDLDEIQGNEEEILSHKLYGARKEILKQLESGKDEKSNKKKPDRDVYIMVEDTSLFLAQYSKKFNFPGPFCKFALKANGCQSYIDMVKGHEDKSCTAMCIFGVLKIGEKEEKPLFFRGECKGNVTEAPRGDKGFGWDPIFEFVGTKKTFAEMTTEEKNKISHRANALKKLKQHLETDLISKLSKKPSDK